MKHRRNALCRLVFPPTKKQNQSLYGTVVRAASSTLQFGFAYARSKAVGIPRPNPKHTYTYASVVLYRSPYLRGMNGMRRRHVTLVSYRGCLSVL